MFLAQVFEDLSLQHLSFVSATIKEDVTGHLVFRSSLQADETDIIVSIADDRRGPVPIRRILFQMKDISTEQERMDLTLICRRMAEVCRQHPAIRLRVIMNSLIVEDRSSGGIDLERYAFLQDPVYVEALKGELEAEFSFADSSGTGTTGGHNGQVFCLFGAEGKVLKNKLMEWGWAEDHWQEDGELFSYFTFVNFAYYHSSINAYKVLAFLKNKGYAGETLTDY